MKSAGPCCKQTLLRTPLTVLTLTPATTSCRSGSDGTNVVASAPDVAEAGSETTTPAEPQATESNAAPEPRPDAIVITHKLGETTITGQPQRVITVGFSEQDAFLALGVTPIAVREWFGGYNHATWPWAQDELGDASLVVLETPFGELTYKTIAGLNPDLIVATHAGLTGEEWETLSKIAPTIVETEDVPSFGMALQEQTRMIGLAVELTYPEDIAELVGVGDSFELSGEQVSLLDVMTKDRFMWLDIDDTVYGAPSFSTALSVDYLLDELTPLLATITNEPAGDASPEEQADMDTFAIVFDGAADWETKLPLLENPTSLEASNDAYSAAGEGMDGVALAPSTAEIDGEVATITYDAFFGGSAAYSDPTRTVVLVDGTWTVDQAGYWDFLAPARGPCVGLDASDEAIAILDAGAKEGAPAIAQFTSLSPGSDPAATGDGPVTVLLPSNAGLGVMQDSNPTFAAALQADYGL